MGKKAVLDLGTNTFHLLIAEVTEKEIRSFTQETIAVKLGEGGINKGLITEAAFDRGVKAVSRFAEIIREHEVSEIRAVGTAALRTASNGAEFIESIKNETGISVQVIDGDLEAKLIYEGVRHGVNMGGETSLILDIGGGSVEFILANDETLFWKRSYPIGAAKLMDLYHKNDPITTAEIEQINQHLGSALEDFFKICKKIRPTVLIGSAGAFETFAALNVTFFNLSESLLSEKEFDFDLGQYSHLSKWIISSHHSQRAARPEIPPVRVDMIVVSTILTNYIVTKLNIQSLKLSVYALKEGLFFSK